MEDEAACTGSPWKERGEGEVDDDDEEVVDEEEVDDAEGYISLEKEE